MSTPPVNRSEELYHRGLAYYRAGNFAGCLECARQALAAGPQDPSLLVLKGMTLIELDQPEQAIEPLQQATQFAPENADAWRQLAVAQTVVGAAKEAVESFQTANRLLPEDVPLLVDLGHALYAIGRTAKAIETLEQARRLWPNDLQVLRSLAGMYATTRQTDQALQATKAILEIHPEDLLAVSDAAWFALELGRVDEAAEWYRLLQRIDPEESHMLYALHGQIMVEIRRQDWRRALEVVIEATRLDRFELTTLFLIFIKRKLFGQDEDQVTEEELESRFEAEHGEHRRQHVEMA